MSIKIKFGDVEIDGLEYATDALNALRILKGEAQPTAAENEPPAPISVRPADVQGELSLPSAEEVEKIPVTSYWLSKKFGASVSSVGRWLRSLRPEVLGKEWQSTAYSLRDFEAKLAQHCGYSDPKLLRMEAADDTQEWYRYRDIVRNEKIHVEISALWNRLYDAFRAGKIAAVHFPHNGTSNDPGTLYYHKSDIKCFISRLGGTIEGGELC